MRRDAKLGLALGMLVVGFAAAFCFPRQPRSAFWLTHQEPEPIADSELDFLPIRAYQPASREPAPILSSDPSPGHAESTDPVPAPLPIGGSSDAGLPSLQPAVEQARVDGNPDASDGRPVAVAPTPPESPPITAQVQTYDIRNGDTLSGISFKFYGTVNRYRQIFEANRQRLSSEDELPVGLTLVIPPKDPASLPVQGPSGSVADSGTGIVEGESRDLGNSPDMPSTLEPARFQRTAGAPFLHGDSTPK